MVSYNDLKAQFDRAIERAGEIWHAMEQCPRSDYTRGEYLQDEFDRIGEVIDVLSEKIQVHPDSAWRSDDDRGIAVFQQEE